ncbi:MAG: glycosyltransferase family 4 protein [Smithellaceae bacterium]
MRKIAVVIPKYGLVGGAEQFASELTEKLSILRHDSFRVFANRWQSNSEAIGFHKIPIISFPKFLTTISFAWFIQKRIQHRNFDLVHSHERIFKADLFTLHGIPHRYWVHSIRCKQMSLYDLATAWVEKKLVYEGHCQKFIAVSELTKAIFLQEYPLNPERVKVIHPGVNLSDYAGKNRNDVRRTTRNVLGIGSEDLVIIFASMNFEIKGLDDIIRSLAHLKSRVKLIVVGKGNVSKYENIARESGVADDVIFTGVVGREKLTDLYLSGDLYMMLSKFDTFGMVVLEAMAAGLPVMISNRVGATDLVTEGKNGFVIDDPSDYAYIASRLNLLLDTNIRAKMSSAAYQTASENSWDSVAKQYSDIYDEILAEKYEKNR